MPPPDDPSLDAPRAAPGAAPEPAAEPEAWAAVLRAWEDEAAHRAYLARSGDLAGLAVAGSRYRAVLAERPGDPIAERFREEVVKRATVQGLASLPRAAPPDARRLRRAVLLAAVLVFGGMTVWATLRLFALLAGGAG